MFHYNSAFRLVRLYGRAFIRGFTVRRCANAIRTEWAYRRRHLVVRSKPYILFIEPLYYCNLRCPLCPRQVPEFGGQKGKIDTGLIAKIFDELGPYLYQCSIFGNGEPTLDWARTAEVIAAARSHKVFTAVSTNATLITAALAERIVDSGLDYLICAIDGVSQEAYESYRVGGSVEDAINGMRMVLEAKRRKKSRMVVEWQFLVHKHNEHEIPRARAIARQMGVAVRFASIDGLGTDPEMHAKWAANNPKYRKGVRFDGVPVNQHHCYWLWRSIYVNATGTLGRCPGYAGTALIGDLHSSSIGDIFNGAMTKDQRRIFRPEPIPAGHAAAGPCDTCTLYIRCHPPEQTQAGSNAIRKSAPLSLEILAAADPSVTATDELQNS